MRSKYSDTIWALSEIYFAGNRMLEVRGIDSRVGWREVLTSLHHSIFALFPLYFVGVVALVLTELPFLGYQNFMSGVLGPHWAGPLRAIHDAAVPLISLTLSTAVGYNFAKLWGDRTDQQLSLVCAMMSPLVLCAITTNATLRDLGSVLATFGVPLAVIVGIASARVVTALSRLLSTRLGQFDFALPMQLSTVLAAAIGSVILFLVAHWLQGLLSAGSPLVARWLQSQIESTQSEYLRIVAYAVLTQAFWSIGMHGNNTWLWAFNRMLGGNTGLGDAEGSATASVVNKIATADFYNAYVSIGGTGGTLGLLLAIYFVTHPRSGNRRIAMLSTPTAIFQVNEPLLFGLPVVLNPVMLIPFFLVPITLCTVAYFAVSLGLVPVGVRSPHWATPMFVNVFHSGVGFPGAALQIVCLAISCCIYWPFVKWAERIAMKSSESQLDRLETTLSEGSTTAADILRSPTHPNWRIARDVLSSFIADAKRGNAYLAYQPKVQGDSTVVGFEALTRWEHPFFRGASAGVFTALAEESDHAEWFAAWTLRIALTDFARWRSSGFTDLEMSVNLSAAQAMNPNIRQLLRDLLQQHQIPPSRVQIELTERDLPRHSEQFNSALNDLHRVGVDVALDDFGMGATSLALIRRYDIKSVKLDRVLVFDVDTNQDTRRIVQSLTEIFNSQSIRISAEHVETTAQWQALRELGLTRWQGFLFSKALPSDDCLNLLKQSRTTL